MAKSFYDFIFSEKRYDKLLVDVRIFVLDNCVLSGSRPSSVDATIFYLKHFGTVGHVKQDIVCEWFGLSAVALRNNVRKVRQSKYWDSIKVMLDNPDIERRI